MRGRFAVITTALVLAAAALTAVVGGSASAVEESSGGVFVPIQPIRIVNATTWTGGSGNFSGAETRSYQVLGVAGVPASNVSAVVVDLAAHGTTAQTSSYLTAWASGETRPGVSSLYYTHDNVPRSNTAIVPVGSNGKISVFNYTGTTSVTVDLQGYFTKTSGEGSSGGFVALHDPVRVANTNTGQGVAQSTIPVGGSVDVQVTGVGDVEDDATSVFANIEVNSATTAGQMRVGPGGTTLTGAAGIDYGTEGRYDSGMSVKLSSNGRLRVTNAAGSPVNIKVDVQGYWSGDPSVGGTFTPLTPTNVYSTAASGEIQLQGKETRAVKIAGVGGLPAAGTLGSAFLTVNVKNWTAGGTVAVFSNDIAWPGTSNVGFDGGEGVPSNGISSTAVARVSSKGYVALYNTSPNPVSVTLTTQGWFSPSSRSVKPSDNESTLAGSVSGVGALSNARMSADLDPNRAYLQSMQPGDEFVPFLLPESAVHVSGNQYSVVLDPDAIPATFVDPDGTVTVNLSYVDPSAEVAGSVTKSVQLVDHAVAPAAFAGRTWAQAGDAAATAPNDDSAPVFAEPEEAEPLDGSLDGTGEDLEGSTPDPDEDSPVDIALSPYSVTVPVAPFGRESASATGGPRRTLISTEYHWVTVGATYPTHGTTAAMSFTTSHTIQSGIAVSAWSNSKKGNWKTSFSMGEEKSVSGGSSWEFHERPYPQSYRVRTLYGLYRYVIRYGPTRMEWRPIADDGGYRPFRLSASSVPTWSTYCSNFGDGEFRRSDEVGRKYTYGAAAKFKDRIGFDLTGSHSWSTKVDTVYNFATDDEWLCGKDAKPQKASKFRMLP